MDDNYHSYLNRVAKSALPDTYASQVTNLQESPKFLLQDQQRVPASFPGYSIITPTADSDATNRGLYENLQNCQQQLTKNMPPDFVALVSPDSFHLTVADLVWDNSYRALADADPAFEGNLQQQIAAGITAYQGTDEAPVHWQIMGLMLRPRAIAVSLVPSNEESYDRITDFRRSVYQNPGLMALGVEQQYHFTAHITIAYFGSIQQGFDQQAFCNLLQDMNMQWVEAPQEMQISQLELRKFTDMNNYQREEQWPTVKI
jgi:hypothetical protein